MWVRLASWVAASVVLAGCASTPPKPLYVSPTQYQALNCEQLAQEYSRINRYLEQGVETPKWQSMGIGIGLGGVFGRGGGVYPSVSVNMGQTQQSARTQYATLLGQRDAIVQAAQFKGCIVVKLGNSSP